MDSKSNWGNINLHFDSTSNAKTLTHAAKCETLSIQLALRSKIGHRSHHPCLRGVLLLMWWHGKQRCTPGCSRTGGFGPRPQIEEGWTVEQPFTTKIHWCLEYRPLELTEPQWTFNVLLYPFSSSPSCPNQTNINPEFPQNIPICNSKLHIETATTCLNWLSDGKGKPFLRGLGRAHRAPAAWMLRMCMHKMTICSMNLTSPLRKPCFGKLAFAQIQLFRIFLSEPHMWHGCLRI